MMGLGVAVVAAGVGVRGVVVGEGVEVEVVVGLEVEVGEGDGVDVGRRSVVGDGDGAGVASAMEGVDGGGDVDSTGCVCAVGSGVGAWPHPPSVRVDRQGQQRGGQGDSAKVRQWRPLIRGKVVVFEREAWALRESLYEIVERMDGLGSFGKPIIRFRLLTPGRDSTWKSNPCLRLIVLGVGFV